MSAFFVGAVVLLVIIRLVGLTTVGVAWQWADIILGILTLFVATVVWYGEAAGDWEASLPKRLRAVFFHAGRAAMICENAVLVSADDQRGWAQQLGAQMAGERTLAFAPFFTLRNPELVREGGSLCKRYEIHLHLRVVPERILQWRALCGPSACLVWRQEGPDCRESIRLAKCGDPASALTENLEN